ncbi:hypothetical protein [Tolypothrix sp. VBCCA 56010]|uniref:hypothetical protein n=1 Tax=Tolypothrix sp. VBCCA 56010 TaxID=3137731 RepID=UPI003D7CAFD6
MGSIIQKFSLSPCLPSPVPVATTLVTSATRWLPKSCASRLNARDLRTEKSSPCPPIPPSPPLPLSPSPPSPLGTKNLKNLQQSFER